MTRRSRLFVTTAVKDWGQSPLSRVPDTDTFSPANLSPDLWLDASDATTITASSGDVSQWNNKGSLGNFTQATGALQPKTGVTTLNGLNVLDFAADYLVAANTNEWKFLHDGTKYIVAAVVKFGTTANPNTVYALLGSSGFSSGAVGATIAYDDRTGLSRSDALRTWVTPAGGSVSVDHGVNDLITPNAFCLATVILDPSNGTANNRSEMFVNGGSGNKGNTASATPSSSNPGNALRIGDDGGVPLTGSLAELIVVSGANATETNRTALRNWLNTKWGVY